MGIAKLTPQEWGNDTLSEWLQGFYENTLATFANLKVEYRLLSSIDKLFFTLNQNLNNPSDLAAALCSLKAHSCYMSAVSLCAGGQLSPAYMVLRGCLEESIYAFYFNCHPELAETWMKRMESEESKKKVRQKFRPADILAELQQADKELGQMTRVLYELAIDWGAHPNINGLASTTEITDTEEKLLITIQYSSGDTPAFRQCLNVTASVGVCSLFIFRRIFLEKFLQLHINEELEKIFLTLFPLSKYKTKATIPTV
jgi:hypothetical protein